jgi:transcriptional regulator with XRE-family HTH domain
VIKPTILAFSAHLRRLREQKHLSQERLALEADISSKTVYRIEKGEHNPTLETLLAIARGLDITIQELVTFEVPVKKK